MKVLSTSRVLVVLSHGLGRNNIGGWPDIDQSVLDYGGFGAPRASEEAIETLMGLGFERNAVIQALESANGNTEAAANILLR